MSEGFVRKDLLLLSEFRSLSQDKLDCGVGRELDGWLCGSLRKREGRHAGGLETQKVGFIQHSGEVSPRQSSGRGS